MRAKKIAGLTLAVSNASLFLGWRFTLFIVTAIIAIELLTSESSNVKL